MAPTNKQYRKLKVGGIDLPTTKHTPTSASCSLENHSNSFVFQLHGQPKQCCIDNEIWPPVFEPEFLRYLLKKVSKFIFLKNNAYF